jgi:hypothetical protein
LRISPPRGLHQPRSPSAEPASPPLCSLAPSRTHPLDSISAERALNPPHFGLTWMDSYASPTAGLSKLTFPSLFSTPRTQTQPGEARAAARAGSQRWAIRDDRGSS